VTRRLVRLSLAKKKNLPTRKKRLLDSSEIWGGGCDEEAPVARSIRLTSSRERQAICACDYILGIKYNGVR
jgi:hypothetical protein